MNQCSGETRADQGLETGGIDAPERTLVRVRYSECDPMGVAHHASYAPWLEIARTDLLRRLGHTYKAMEQGGVFLVITRLEVRYRRPVLYDDVIEVAVQAADVTPVRLVHRYELRLCRREGDEKGARAGDALATASTELACVGRDGRARRLPPLLTGPGPA